MSNIDMSAPLGSHVTLPNPVSTASGCAGYGRELHRFVPLSSLGTITTKTIMPYVRSGRPTPRMAETPSGMLNSIGLQGSGIDHFVEHELPWLAEQGARVLVSIAGERTEEFAEAAARLKGQPGVVGIEANISCPNVANRGLVFACDASSAYETVRAVRDAADPAQPVYAKLTPDVTSIVDIAAACTQAGADGLSMINTLLGMVVDADTLRPRLAGTTGGLSGPAIRPVAVRCVYQVYAAMRAGSVRKVPILGMGGITSGRDALEFVLAGASGVALGTVLFNDPSAPVRVLEELESALAERDFTSLQQAIGFAHTGN
ncbi:dihydroorotate dehydrogenase [Streptomyces sp. TRM66268-LWL]|uniref:Dihydroorotate dehydrogenase n=1 Tax=Streptomyces polyasparticus TaxID=2767826 RepID=A0ABR7SME6_9ACTN|nr:dihydroorotate dehydrogenase [Streptomyces polyasparticus]MBC9715676.1 dihydroorotate dehydrogenase [Streptomyces polyasparticus]